MLDIKVVLNERMLDSDLEAEAKKKIEIKKITLGTEYVSLFSMHVENSS